MTSSGRGQGALGGVDTLAETGGAGQQAGGQSVADPQKGDLGEGDAGLVGVDQLVVAGGHDPAGRGRVEEFPTGFEGLGDHQDMGESVLGRPKRLSA